MLNRLSVQNKILATLAVPILVIFAASALFVWDAIQGWRTASQMQSMTEFVAGAEDILDVIQNERYWALEQVRGVEGAQEKWDEATQKRTDALDALSAQYAKIVEEDRYSLVAEEIVASMANVQSNLRPLVALAHTEAERNASQISVISRSYTDAITLLLDFIDTLGNAATNAKLGDATVAWENLSHYKDEILAEKPLVAEAIIDGRKATGGSRTLAVDVAADVRDTTAVRTSAQNAVRRAYSDNEWTLPAQNTQYGSIRHLASQTNAGAVSYDVSTLWPEHVDNTVAELEPIRDDLVNRMLTAASNEVSSERTTVALTILTVVLTLALSLGLAYLISRSITRPIRNLSQAAENVKNELPRLVEQVAVPGSTPDFDIAPIEIQSRDEVGQLAASFNAVNQTTVDIAREQAALRASIAEMFVNVARRDHVLLNRQLRFLDELERQEEDPSILANLFRLDHLATRMRRNSESLLVLAGIDSGRRVRRPMAMSDVIRTASSEIEQYDRVQLNLQTDPMMLGHNALNAAHLIAELLENATNFSEPNTPVEVTTAQSKHFMTVTIRDYGLGMSEADIEEANKKVASRSASDVVGVQRVGLFVVGRLADRLGVHLTFSRPTDGTSGTVIALSFPFTLFTATEEQPLPQPTDPLSAANQQATEQWISPEPGVAVPVDLTSLTDGTTTTGMPKRRVAPGTPSADAFTPQMAQDAPASSGLPSRAGVGISPEVQESDIVLPPLATPLAPVQQESATWQPDSAPLAAGSGLPTRKSAEQPNVPGFADEHDITPKEPEQRSAMFSNFRSFNPNAVRPQFEEFVDPQSPIAEDSESTFTSTNEQVLPVALEPLDGFAGASDAAYQPEFASASEADAFVPQFADEFPAPAADASAPVEAGQAASFEASEQAFTPQEAWSAPSAQEPEFVEPADFDTAASEYAYSETADSEFAPQFDAQLSQAEESAPAVSGAGEDGSYFAHGQYQVSGPGIVSEAEINPATAPTRQVRTAFSALSPASGAEWAERFASLPTRASLAREARMAGIGSATDAEGLPQVDPAQVAPLEENLEVPASDGFSGAEHVSAEHLSAEHFTSVDSSTAEQSEDTSQFAPEATEPVTPASPSEMWIPTFADEETPALDEADFQPVARVGSPEDGAELAPLDQPYAFEPVAEYQPLESPQLEPAFTSEPVPAVDSVDQDFNPGHPFTPLSAPSAISPIDQQQPTGANSPQFGGLTAPTGAVAPAGTFADVVSDLPAQPEKKQKQGLFANLFKKKEKAPKASKKAKGKEAEASQPTGHSFAPITPGTGPLGTPDEAAGTAASGFGQQQLGQQQLGQPQFNQPQFNQPQFNQPTLAQPNQGFTPLAPAQTGIYQQSEITASPFGAPNSPASAIGGAASQTAGEPNFAGFVPAESASGLPTRGALPAVASSENSDAPFVPTFQAGAPLGAPAQEDEPYVPTFQAGAPLGAPAQDAPSAAWSPAEQPQAFGAGNTPHWEPPALFGQEHSMALQSTIQEQAFAELSELSAYRPNQVSTGNTNLTRRVRTQMERPTDDPSAQKISRDAAELRSRLSAFQSATARGRQDGVSAQSVQGAEGNEVPTRVPDSVNE